MKLELESAINPDHYDESERRRYGDRSLSGSGRRFRRGAKRTPTLRKRLRRIRGRRLSIERYED